jgi:hypothetical protein
MRYLFSFLFASFLITQFSIAQESLSTLYSKLYSKNTNVDSTQTRILLEKRFQQAAADEQTEIAMLLLAIEEEDPTSGSRWSQWLLDSPNSKLMQLHPSERCRVYMSIAAAKFVRKEFTISEYYLNKVSNESI